MGDISLRVNAVCSPREAAQACVSDVNAGIHARTDAIRLRPDSPFEQYPCEKQHRPGIAYQSFLPPSSAGRCAMSCAGNLEQRDRFLAPRCYRPALYDGKASRILAVMLTSNLFLLVR